VKRILLRVVDQGLQVVVQGVVPLGVVEQPEVLGDELAGSVLPERI
jgi:hypothetical protein